MAPAPGLIYLRRLAVAVAGLIMLSGALAAAVDPYYIFDAPRIAGFNRFKPRSVNQGELAKLHQASRICGRTVILGNSRLEVGMDPDSPAWPAEAHPVFNGASAGRGPEFALQLFRSVVGNCPPRRVVLQADFPDALTPPADFAAPDTSFNWRDRAKAALTATLTGDALADSIATVVLQASDAPVHLTPAGFNPLDNLRAETLRSGYNTRFAQKDQSYGQALRRGAHPDLRPDRNFALGIAQTILAIAGTRQIEVVVLVLPYHARYLDLIRDTGRAAEFAAWKRALRSLVADAHAQGGQVRLLDAATRHRYAMEPVPPRGDRTTEMQFYWESGHFKKALGDLLINDMFLPAGQAGGHFPVTPD